MTAFSVNRQTNSDGAVRIAVIGDIDADTCELVERAIHDAVTSTQPTELVVDLGQVTYLDSSGISALIRGHTVAADNEVTYLVTTPHTFIHKALKNSCALAADRSAHLDLSIRRCGSGAADEPHNPIVSSGCTPPSDG